MWYIPNDVVIRFNSFGIKSSHFVSLTISRQYFFRCNLTLETSRAEVYDRAQLYDHPPLPLSYHTESCSPTYTEREQTGTQIASDTDKH